MRGVGADTALELGPRRHGPAGRRAGPLRGDGDPHRDDRPATIFVGENLSEEFIVLPGTLNVDELYHTEFFVNQIFETTTTHHAPRDVRVRRRVVRGGAPRTDRLRRSQPTGCDTDPGDPENRRLTRAPSAPTSA